MEASGSAYIMSLLWTFLTALSEKILFAKIYLHVSKLKLAFTKALSYVLINISLK